MCYIQFANKYLATFSPFHIRELKVRKHIILKDKSAVHLSLKDILKQFSIKIMVDTGTRK